MAAGESPRIVKYTGIAYVTDTDRQRMAAYDCSCEVSRNEHKFSDGYIHGIYKVYMRGSQKVRRLLL